MFKKQKIMGHGVVYGVILLLLTACSTGTQLGYRFLDDLMRWRLNEYVTLDGSLSGEVDTALDNFHAWHRQEQLPQYRDFLALQMKLLQRERINASQLQQAYDRGMTFWKASMQRLVPDMVQLFSQLDQVQLKQLQKNMDVKNAEYEEERIKLPVVKRQQEREKRMRKSLEKWIGTLTDEQDERVQQWVDSISYDTAARLQQRRLMRQRFDESLVLRERPQQMQQRLAQLIVTPEQRWTPAYRQYVYFNRQQIYRLMVDLHASLTPAQKQKLLNKLDGYRRDFAALIR